MVKGDNIMAFNITRTVYEKVELRFYKNGKCSICSKPMKRQTTFYQTLNPFNKNKNGSIKTRQEIYE
jgi:hypothetical protein